MSRLLKFGAADFRSLISLWLGALLIAAMNLEGAANDQPIAAADNEFEIRLLNLSPESVDLAALKDVCRTIVQFFARNELVPVKVVIFAQHPIVKDALADRTIEITIHDAGKTMLLVPVSQNGSRIIVKRPSGSEEAMYSLVSLPDNVRLDLKSCVH